MAAQTGFLASVGRGLMAFAGYGGSPYNAGRYDRPETGGWNKRPIHAESHWSNGNDTIVGRAEDSDRNDAWINGGLDRDVEATVGTGLRPWPTPIYGALGKDFAWAAGWGEKLLSAYRVWAEDPLKRCDAQMLLTLGELERLAYLNYRRVGECLFEIRKDERGATNRTNILLIDPKRIDNPMGKSISDPNFKNGIEYQNGIPIAAWIRPFHPDDSRMDKGTNEPVRVAFRTSTGTPKLVLISNKRFVEQVRGVSPLTGSMTVSKNLDEYEKDVANRARLETQAGAFIHSDASNEEVAEIVAPGSTPSEGNALAAIMDWRNTNPIKAIGGLFFRHLVGQEKITFMPPATPGNNYNEFRKSNIAKISSPMGWSSPEVSQDYEGINLSNMRAIDNKRHRTVLQNREVWARQFNASIYIAWMEEEVASGRIKIPGGPAKFYVSLSAITNATWIGPGRGTIDPMKEGNGRNLEEAANRASPIDHILQNNQYPSEVWDQKAYAMAEMTRRGLPMPDYNTKGSGAEGEDGSGGEGGNPADGDQDGVPNEAAKKKAKPKQGDGQ